MTVPFICVLLFVFKADIFLGCFHGLFLGDIVLYFGSVFGICSFASCVTGSESLLQVGSHLFFVFLIILVSLVLEECLSLCELASALSAGALVQGLHDNEILSKDNDYCRCNGEKSKEYLLRTVVAIVVGSGLLLCLSAADNAGLSLCSCFCG